MKIVNTYNSLVEVKAAADTLNSKAKASTGIFYDFEKRVDGHYLLIRYGDKKSKQNEKGEAMDLKHDKGKPLAACIAEFGPALLEVAKVATFGAQKYERSSWKSVPNGKQRYQDAQWRHMLERQGEIEHVDEESGYLSIAHEIWNLLAVLTLHLEKKNEG